MSMNLTHGISNRNEASKKEQTKVVLEVNEREFGIALTDSLNAKNRFKIGRG